MEKALHQQRYKYRSRIAFTGFVLGLVYAIATLPIYELIFMNSAFWYHGDPGSHISAAQIYLNEPLGWPLLHIQSINYPAGINGAFVDIIPLITLPTKVISHFLEIDVDARIIFTSWIVICYGGIGLTSIYLLNFCFNVSRMNSILGALIFLTSPIVLFRVHAHLALVGQFWILAAFIVYFHRVEFNERFSGLLLQLGLTLGALLTHPYLFAMVVPVIFAGEFDLWIKTKNTFDLIVRILSLTMVTILFLIFFGYLGSESVAVGSFGFGLHSMNLASPWTGSSFYFFPEFQEPHKWYPNIPFPIDATGGQYEGYAYLGIGVLILLPFGIFLLSKIFYKKYLFLVMCLMTFFMLSISNEVYLGRDLLIHVPISNYLQSALDVFRASARFFWPIFFAIYLLCLVAITRFVRPWMASVVLFSVIFLQILDIKPLRSATQKGLFNKDASLSVLSEDKWWSEQAQNARHLLLLPTTGCGARTYEDILPLQIFASQKGLNFNTGTIARGYGGCDEKITEAVDLISRGDALVVFLNENASSKVFGSLDLVDAASRCGQRDQGYVCVF